LALTRKDDEMYASSIDLPDNVRSSSIALLNARLADAIDLAAQLKYAHWNVHGPHFMGLHVLFDDLHDEADGYADLLAERVAAFGGAAEGTLQHAVAATSLPTYPTDANTEHGHLEVLGRSLAAFAGKARAAIQDTADAGDLGTADIFTEISRAADKALWKIEAHFRPKRA
jgi:starvation-inducible DNA-binding protein